MTFTKYMHIMSRQFKIVQNQNPEGHGLIANIEN